MLVIALWSSSVVYAAAALTITPITWNTVGLDSNNVNVGPNLFPVGARVCNTGDATANNVTSSMIWDTTDAYIDFRLGSLTSLSVPSLAASECTDFYYEVEIARDSNAYDHVREYHITADSTETALITTETPRQIYVEHLISQNRNGINDVKLDGVSIPAGGEMNLVVGNTYIIELDGFTATQGYNQLESFINFPNIIFQVLSVSTTYSADSNTTTVPNPNDTQYANACVWDEDPNSPTYNNCIGNSLDKAGGNVTMLYTVKILSGGGTTQTLNTLLYDFSGSSYHYNSDFSTGARIANIIDPADFPITKSFSPDTIFVNGISTLTITLGNPTSATVSAYNFTDPLPTNVVVANPPSATTSGCGSPTFAPLANDTVLSFSDGTLAPNSSCVITVQVTANGTGSPYTNTTNNLFIGTSNTGNNASAVLSVSGTPPAGTGCTGATATLAQWTVPTTSTNPPDLTGGLPTTQAGNVATATAAASNAARTNIDTSSGSNDTASWNTYGYANANRLNNNLITFTVDTTNYTNVTLTFSMRNPSGAPGPNTVYLDYDAGSGFQAPIQTIDLTSSPYNDTNWHQHTQSFTGLTNSGGNTIFRLSADNANNDNSNSGVQFDDIKLTGTTSGACTPPTLDKTFSPNPIKVGGVSTLTFTLNNSNSIPLANAGFSDNLPAGVQVAATPNDSTTCAGTPTWSPNATDITLVFTNGTIPGNSSCTVQVDVTATTPGPHVNVSGYLSTNEAGTNTDNLATDTLTALNPPQIAKQFAPNPIIPNGISKLTFTITNPNQNDAISGVAFSDVFPNSPAQMVVATPPNETYSGCGAGTFGVVNGAEVVLSFTGGTIAAGGTCTVTVDTTAPNLGAYANTSGTVSHIINAETVNGNTAADTLNVNPPTPALKLTKQVSSSATGPWTTFVPVPVGANVYYRFVVENAGDVPLTNISVSDVSGTPVDTSTCVWVNPLPVASPTEEATDDCILGPVSAVAGSNPNTADGLAVYNSVEYPSNKSTATYATTGLNIVKSVQELSFTQANDVLHYSYLVTNSGFAPLQGPVTIDDDKATDESCPAVNTVGDLDNFLDPKEEITCTATYTVTEFDVLAGFVTNNASATADGVTSNTDTETVNKSGTTALNVTGLRGALNKRGYLVISWRTTNESTVAGFNVYRKNGKGEWKQINAQFIQAKHAGDPTSDKYRFADKTAKRGKTYRYKIEVIYLDTHSEWTNTIRVKMP